MAHYVVNPKTGRVVEATKKGTTESGYQRWRDRDTGESFRTEFGAENQVDQRSGQLRGQGPRSSSQPTSGFIAKGGEGKTSQSAKKTRIYVNSNQIREIEGDLTVKDTTELIGAYFREASENNASVNYDKEGNKVVTYRISSGSKS